MVVQIPVVWSDRTLAHEPGGEVWVGVTIPGTEVPARVETIRDALAGAGHRLVEAAEREADELARVHDPALVSFLATAEERWRAGPYAAEAGQERVVPYLFPTPAMAGGLPLRTPTAVHAEVGTYGYDTMTLLGPGSWSAIAGAAACALDAADLVLGGERTAYALSRPPGHHATRAGYGGSCYLNNAALAAQRLRDGGHERVAVVDVDAHHGNGTAAIFYDRADVLYGSVHVDPGAGWFPHYVGFAEETGTGAGAGATRNLPLPEGTGDEVWVEAVAALAAWVRDAGCTALVVSLGVDAAADDPESPLLVTHDGYRSAGRLLGGTGLPGVLVQEGGYHLPSLGSLVAAYVEGHAGG
jgi:acetoin utilization deacetylase AcuC-like enzyme